MAELSNEGSGLAAETSSARTSPYASLMLSSVGASGRIADRMPARWSSTEVRSSASRISLTAVSPARLQTKARSWQTVQVLAQPGHDLLGQVGPLARELDQRAQVVQLVAGVVAPAVEQHAAHRAALGRVHPGQGQQRVGELDLPAPPGRSALQHFEYCRVAHVPPDQDPVARR